MAGLEQRQTRICSIRENAMKEAFRQFLPRARRYWPFQRASIRHANSLAGAGMIRQHRRVADP